MAVDVAGGFAIFLYPPMFALAFVPFALLPDAAGLWLWEGLAIASFLVGVAILPVRPGVRWGVLLLGALDWPLLYAVKLGQVGPLLFLLFAVGWRCLDRAVPLGLSMAAGAMIKVQPLHPARLGRPDGPLACGGCFGRDARVREPRRHGRVRACASGRDYVALLRQVSSPVTTPHNFTPGAIAYQAGMSEAAAGALQVVAMVARRRRRPRFDSGSRRPRSASSRGRRQPAAVAAALGPLRGRCCCCRSPGCSSDASGGRPRSRSRRRCR